MNVFSLMGSLNREQRNAFLASFLGWTLAAFDFFILTFVTLRIAKDFNVALPAIAFTITLTLMLRPVGALLFGILADRFGRRTPLMIDIICYSVTLWAVNGGLVRRWLWSHCQRKQEDSSPAFSSKATPAATCSPPLHTSSSLTFSLTLDGVRCLL